MGAISIQQMADRVAALMEERLGLRGQGLAAKAERARRSLPRPVHAAALRLAEAAHMTQNPKTLLMVDEARVAADYDLCLRHLQSVDPTDRRLGRLVGFTLRVLFILAVTAGLAFAVLRWRGLV